jgi:hypothetical protein
MEIPKERKQKLWEQFQSEGGLKKPSKGFKAVLLVIVALLVPWR